MSLLVSPFLGLSRETMLLIKLWQFWVFFLAERYSVAINIWEVVRTVRFEWLFEDGRSIRGVASHGRYCLAVMIYVRHQVSQKINNVRKGRIGQIYSFSEGNVFQFLVCLPFLLDWCGIRFTDGFMFLWCSSFVYIGLTCCCLSILISLFRLHVRLFLSLPRSYVVPLALNYCLWLTLRTLGLFGDVGCALYYSLL